MAEKTDEQIAKDNSATIDALSVYLDDVAPSEQFGSNPLHRIGNIQPIQTQEDLFERGLIGEDGLLTPKGDLYKTLSDNGLINPDGTLPEKSAAFMMDEDDALKPENLDAYVIRRENKIGEKPMSWGDTFGGLGELLWDAGAGLGTMVKLGIQNIGVRDVAYTDPLGISSIPASEEKLQEIQKRKDQLLNRSSIAATSFVENSIKAFSETGAIVNLAGAAVSSIPARIMGDEKIASDQVNAARQAQDRLIKSNQDAAIGSTLDAVFQTATYVPEMARVKSEMPKAEFDKIIKQTGAAGQIFADPVELAKIGTVMKLATQPIVSRLTLNAERVIGKASDRAARLAEINVEIADVERAKGMTQNAAELARKTADAARERFDLNGDQLLLQRANAAEEIFNRSTAKVSQFTADGARLANEAAELTAETQKLASRIPVAAAQAFEATAKAGRELKSVPFRAFAATIEPVSRGLIALDDGLDAVSKKLGIGAAYDIMTSKVGQAVGYGAAIGLGPAPALIGAAGSVLKSGPFLQRLADTSRILGTEMAKAQSQVPFFQRVANNPMISPAHRSLAHLSDLATLGGFLPDITRRAAKGAAVSFPLDFAAQYMSDGGEINQNTFKQAFAESLLIGGSSAALGGMFAGTKQRHRDLAVNDEINFRNEITAPDQKQLFTSAPSGIRRAVGTFAAVFPSVNIQFTQEGGGFHDDNTIGIDLNSSNPLKYLLAHEVKHLLVHRNQMHTPIVAMMLGDGEAGGIMRAPDGTLNPEFEAFAKEYNNRQIAAGRAPVSLGKIAEEFFVEAGVEDMARMSESGELGAIASRTEARRMIGRLFNSVFDKSTVLKDFHLRIGGLMDQGGKLVQGNGLLNPGITQTQEMRNMTRNMLKRAAGRSVGQFEPLGAAEAGNKGEGPGINLPINPDDKAMIEKIGPVMFEMETVNGRRQVVRDSDGNPVPVDFNTQLMRSRTGALIQEAIGNRPSTYQSSPNEMRLNDEGIWEGYLPPDIIEFIKKKGSLNQEQIRMIEHVNSMIKNFKGDVALVINHPATSRNKKGKLNYKTLKATLRQVVPISWNLTKDGNLTLGLMSVTQLKSNIDARISSRLGQQLYQGNRAKLMVDIGKVMELHQQGKRTDEYFDTEYGAAKSQQFKNFVNSVFGLMTKKQGEANPIFSEENLRGNGVYKTYRADRISQATKMTGDKYPFQYDFVVQNMMPNGLPTLDDQGRPVTMNRLPEPVAKNKVAKTGKEKQNKQETNGPTKKDGKGRIYQRSIRDESDVGRKFAEGITRTASEHPMGSAVEVKDASFYDDPDTKLFLAPDNLTGVAVTSYGDLVSVFKHPTSKEKILPILEEAAEYARTLDAYDINGFLPTLYSKVGFRPVARIAFDSEFVPKTWPYDLAGTPDVVLMVKDPEGLSGAPEIGDEGYNAIRDQVPMYATYDEAMDAQQKAIESINRLSAPVNPAAPDVEFKKPLSRDEPLPDIDDTVIDDAVDVDGFAFDRPAKVYMQHPGGGRTYFNYDPAYLIKPEFKGLRATLEGKNVIILEADKMRATGGDMGGALHPFLRSNQVVVRGSDGKLYKAVWANMNSSFVTRTKNRWFDDKAEYALIHLMDDVAHSSNKRVARIMEEAWEKANLSNYEQRMISVAMQAAITAQQKATYSQKITQTQKKIKEGDYTTAEIKEFNDLIKQHTKDRDALSWTGIDEQIAKKITQIKSSQTSLQNKTGTQASVDKAKKALRDFLDENPANLAAFNSISNKTASLKISDNIGDTFKSRGAAIQGLLGIVFNKFNPSDLLKKTEDFQGSENMDLVAAVQLSKNKDIFAVYFGKDPNEEAAMSASERDVRDKLRADPNFVEHEAFDWMMLGPENADNFLAESSLKPEELIPEYRNKHEKASVKTGSEETVLGAMKMFAGIPLKVVKKTQAQLEQFEKKRNERLTKRKAEKVRKEEIKKISNKLKSRDANLEKLATQIASASEKPLLKSLKLKAAEVKKDRNALARQITKLQNMN